MKLLENTNLSNLVINKLKSKDPYWLARLGGSDYGAFINLYKKSHRIPKLNKLFDEKRLISIIKQYNGYFDFNEDEKILNKTIEIYIKSSQTADICTLTCFNDLKHQIINKTAPFQSQLGQEYCPLISYDFIENIYPFLNSFKSWGKNKKILIISPFKDTIDFQTDPKRLNNLLKNYIFPECEFKTYRTPITYNIDGFDSKYFKEVTAPYNNWIELAEKMIDDISKIDFDVAFISAGIYTMFLGDKIKTMLGKKAIYIGGVLNVIFNISGKRYDNETFKSMQNLDFQVKVMDDFGDLLDKSNSYFVSEGVNAYFN